MERKVQILLLGDSFIFMGIFFPFFTNVFLQFSDEGLRLACGLTLQAISRYSSDVMKRHAAKALPAVFFAMNEKKNKQGELSAKSS